MTLEEANYVIKYFPRLMKEVEKEANRHYFYMLKLGNPEEYDNLRLYQIRKRLFEERNWISKDKEVGKLLENGYDEFVKRTAKRIKVESPDEFIINRCPTCETITRTPYSKQCRYCGYDWHHEIRGEFQFEMALKIKGRPYFWIIGELLNGDFEIGNRIDLTNFQLNILTEIKQIEFCLKWVDGVKKEFPSLGIRVNEQEENLIKKYLTKSAKAIMILD